jgi:uncharacterized protein (TIGR03083 family)
MPIFPGEEAMRTERAGVVATLESMTPEVFESGPTLCAGWAPRDVLGHLLGTDDLGLDYARGLSGGNARQVSRYRAVGREELLARARLWAGRPALHSRMIAAFLIGDVSIHHQDLLRPNGIAYDLPRASAAAVYREGAVLSGTRLLHNRLLPTDGIGRPVGFGRHVSGGAVALGLWLSGRPGLDDELTFG